MSQTLDQDLALVDEAVNHFMQAMSRPRAWENVAARAGIATDRAGSVLLQFLEDPELQSCHLSDLAHKLGIEAPSVTRKVQQLEREGLVARVADPDDRRAFVLKTTVQGRRVLQRLHRAKHELFMEVLRDWPAQDRTTFARLFRRLAEDMTGLMQEQAPKRPLVPAAERGKQ